MKKITLISATFLSLFISSCRKENLPDNQTNQNKGESEETVSINNLMNHPFKYKKEVKVYEETNIYFVTVSLESDNDSVLNNAVEEYSTMEMVLLYKKSSIADTTNMRINKNVNTESTPNMPLNNKLLVKFNIIDKGNSIGFTLRPKKVFRDDIDYFSPAIGTRTFYHTCTQLYVYVQSGTLNSESVAMNDYGTHWSVVETHGTINAGSSWTFSQGGYANKILTINSPGFTYGSVYVIY